MIEDVLEKMREILIVNLSAQLDAQDVAADDGIKCDKVKGFVVGEEPRPSSGFPLILLRPESMQQSLFATAKKDVDYRIAIGVAVSDTNHDRGQRKLWRTMRAVESVFEVFGPGNGPIIDYQTVGMDFNAPLLSIEEGKSTEKTGVIEATVRERLVSYTAGQI